MSQRKHQDKYFVDCCVAAKAVRNFSDTLFPEFNVSPNNNNNNNNNINNNNQTHNNNNNPNFNESPQSQS